MNSKKPITVLVADSHAITREATAALVRALDMDVLQAIDTGSAIKVVQEHPLDLVIFDNIMRDVSGFELAHYIHGANIHLPMIMIAEEQAVDQLQYANSLGIRHILKKPLDPHRLTAFIGQILLREKKIDAHPKMAMLHDRPTLTPEQIMTHTIELARKNVLGGFGGPFASVVANAHGNIIGEGVNLPTSRFDPIAHAEVMAVRKATDFLQQPHLEGCTIYSTSEPTRLALALIESVGLTHLVYGLQHHELKSTATKVYHATSLQVTKLAGDAVLQMLKDIRYV